MKIEYVCHKYKFTYAMQRGQLPKVNSIVRVDDDYGVVTGVDCDEEYYPNEWKHHSCINVFLVDPTIQESKHLVPLHNDNNLLLCFNDLIVERKGKQTDCPKYLQSLIYGIVKAKGEETERKEKEKAVAAHDVCVC